MKLASYNLENLFERPAILNLPNSAENRDTATGVLKDLEKLNSIIDKPAYSASDKTKLTDILNQPEHQGVRSKNRKSDYIRLRETRKKLFGMSSPYDIKVDGRAEWEGWFELVPEIINSTAVGNTGAIIKEVDADVFGVIEVEHRPAMVNFEKEYLRPSKSTPYFETAMLIDGNDERGIDVGIYLRNGYTIDFMRSHVGDTDDTGIIFSRDCAEYHVLTPKGNRVVILVNHFKSKSGGGEPKRLRQATRVREIVNSLLNGGHKYVAVIGDLNDGDTSAPLQLLLTGNPKLSDIMKMAPFQNVENRPGTYSSCTASNRLDYILLSPELSKLYIQGGVNRNGIWAGANGDLLTNEGATTLPSINSEAEAASDHAALWVELNV